MENVKQRKDVFQNNLIDCVVSIQSRMEKR
jgi:hypothetical protein